MDKKKVITLILGVIIIAGGTFVGYKATNDKKGKTVSNTTKTVQTTTKQESKNVDDITSPDYIPVAQRGVHDYKEEVQDINGEKVTVMTGTYTKDPKTSTYWLGGKKIAVPDFYTCISTADKSSTQIGSSENLQNAVVMKIGNETGKTGTTNYMIASYSGPYSRTIDMPSHPNDKFIGYYGKVVSADASGITLDDGKKYNANDAQFIQMKNQDSIDKAKYLHKYNPNDFPKNTLVSIIFWNGKLYNIARFCILK